MNDTLPIEETQLGQQMLEIHYCNQCNGTISHRSRIHIINIAQDIPVKRFCCKQCRDRYITHCRGEISKEELFYSKKAWNPFRRA